MINYKKAKKILIKSKIKIKDELIDSSKSVNRINKLDIYSTVNYPAGTNAAFDVNDLLLGGKSIIGVVEGNSAPKKFIPELVQLYQQGLFPFDKLIKFYGFDEINQAALDSQSGITLKPVIRIQK